MIFTSPYPDVDIPSVALTDFVLEHSAEYGDKPALIDGATGRSYTHAQTAEADRAPPPAASPRAASARATSSRSTPPNSPEYVVAFHAVAALGAVVTTINPVYTVDELAFQLQHAGARALLSAAGSTARGGGGRARPSRSSRVGVDGRRRLRRAARRRSGARRPTRRRPRRPRRAALLERHHGPAEGRDAHPPQPGREHLQSTAQQPVTADDTLVGVLPLFHIYGMTVIMNAACATARRSSRCRASTSRASSASSRSTARRRPTSCRRSSSRWPRARSSSATTCRA